MIYNGRTGYLTGSMNQAANTVLAMTAGPIKGRNWHTTTANPQYQIVLSAGTGVVELQGTNTVAFGGTSLTEMDIMPTDGAVWTTIATATAPISASGSIALEYEYLRLIITTQGTATVLNSWVRWS